VPHRRYLASHFIRGGRVQDYPPHKLVINRLANWFIQTLFALRLNDMTNAFKACWREVIDGIQPLISPHFNLTVEMPLKAIVRGYSYTVLSISWSNRQSGVSKLKLKEMGSRHLCTSGLSACWQEATTTARSSAPKPAKPTHV
jgi:dolichol-phosphate mannosyltransferase